MVFYFQKCIIIYILRKCYFIKVLYYLYGYILEEVLSGKYFGVIISEDLFWCEYINVILVKVI